MKAEVVNRSDDGQKIRVRVTGVDVELVNALRRTVLSKLPSFAIDEVDVYENNSVFFNEYLANRLGLVPLTYEEGIGDDVKVTLSLNSDGPCTVYSGELRSTDEKIRPFRETIPIAKLGANQRIRLEAVAIKGNAAKHAKFQCGLASYSQVPDVGKTKSLCGVHAAEAGLEPKEGVSPEKCEACALDEKGELKYRDDEFIFFIESYNNLSAEELLDKAIELMAEEAEVISKELK